MSSIFVSSEETIPITVAYKVSDAGAITILDDDKAAGSESITVQCRRPDFAMSQRLMSLSTTTDGSGNPSFNFMQLQNNVLYALAKSWDVKDDKGKPVDLNNERISELRVEIARALTGKILEKVGPIF